MKYSIKFPSSFSFNFSWRITRAFAFLLILIACTSWGAAHAQGVLFSQVDDNALADAPNGADSRLAALRDAPTTAAIEIVKTDLSALDESSVVIALPGGGSIIAEHTRTNVRGPTDFSWFASLSDGGTVIFVVRDGQITGSIRSVGDQYQVTPLVDDIHAVIKVDSSKFPPEHPYEPPDGSRSDGGDTAPDSPDPDIAADSEITIDVLVAYTPAAASAAGNILSLIQLAVDESNQAYAQSNANVVLNLVGTMTVNYTETATNAFGNALNDVTNGTGVMSAVHAERDAKGADVVSLFIDDSQYCGLAWLNSNASSAFSVVAYNCATGYYSFSHEIGHNIGAHHDPANGTNTVYPYGHGYYYSTQWRTIMSYGNQCGNCTRIPWFSNPNKTYGGQPMGTTATHDNARVHRERASAVAAFRIRTNPIRDFNGDGLSDILWRHSGGSVGISLMQAGGQSTTWVSLGGPATSSGWSIVGIGDFNGDGRSDILWRNTSGSIGIWLMQAGGQSATWVGLGNVSSSWSVQGVGDFNGDGRSDILWRNTSGSIGSWLMQAGGQSATWVGLGSVSSSWFVQRMGDFNGDGRSDILWRNSSGLIGSWLVQAGGQSATWAGLGSVSSSWSVQGVGDSNGNGLSDILWRNTSGSIGSWLMQAGGQSATWVGLGSVSSSWSVQGVGDSNGDGRSDILWRNTSGSIGSWLMQAGGQSATWVGLGSVSTSWTIVDP